MSSPFFSGVLRAVGWVVLCLGANLFANAQPEQTKQVAQEILNASKENGTFISISRDGYHLTAGLHLSSVPADGESLIWGVVELLDAYGKPIPGAVVELNTTAGVIHWLDNVPATDAEGRFIFAVQSSLQPTSFRVRFNFPQFGVGGTLPGSFCRIGEPDCFLPSACAGIGAAWEYQQVREDQTTRTCSNIVADVFKFYANEQSPAVIYFEDVTFKNNRPEGAFPEKRYPLQSWICHGDYGMYDFCRCLRGYKEGTDAVTYGEDRVFHIEPGLPNGENIAEVTTLQYRLGTAGRICRHQFRFGVSNPVVHLSHQWVVFPYWFENDAPSPTIDVEIESPDWEGDVNLVIRIPDRLISKAYPIRAPGRHTITLNRRDFDNIYQPLAGGVPIQIQATLTRGRESNDAYDSTLSLVRMENQTLKALGYNPQRRTFDFAFSYTLTTMRQVRQRTPLVANARIDVHFDRDTNSPIHSETVGSEHLTAGSHTVIVRIPENQMTRFGTYHFVPRFTDNFARYYADERPRQVIARSLSFLTPEINYSYQIGTAYLQQGSDQTPVRRHYPYEGDSISLITLISASAAWIDTPSRESYRFAYVPVSRSGVYVTQRDAPNSWLPQDWMGEVYPRDYNNFFSSWNLSLERIERNDQANEDSNHRLWPGPKLEFRWVEITHQTGETADRTYWYTLREVSSGSPVYSLTARRGTKRYAVAVTNPHWDYYLVGGIGRIPKNQWSQYVSGNTKIDRATARAAMRISARERITGSDTNYRLRLLEWATAFIGVKYDWGGCWFGGRVHPTDKDGDYYNGFGLDCSKLISATAMLSGMRWWDSQRYGRRNQHVRWWDVGTVHIREDALPLTQRWNSATEARNQVSPGDVIISKKHVAYLYSIVRQSTEVDRQGVVTKRYVWELQVIDASGGDDPKTKHHVEGYNEVRISDGTHLLSNSLILQVAASERDYNGARRMSEWVDMLRAFEKRGYSFRRIRETSN